MNNILNMRKKAGFLQADVADRLCIDRSTVAKWETGEAMPRADKLPLLAQLLGCTIDELFEHEG